MDGYEVMPMIEAVKLADIIICATGDKDIIRREHLEALKDGCVMGNVGATSTTRSPRPGWRRSPASR